VTYRLLSRGEAVDQDADPYALVERGVGLIAARAHRTLELVNGRGERHATLFPHRKAQEEA
jgi:hypothetical protein